MGYITYSYINESGQRCEAAIVDSGKFDYKTGDYPKYRYGTRDASFFQKHFEEKLKKCKNVTKTLVPTI